MPVVASGCYLLTLPLITMDPTESPWIQQHPPNPPWIQLSFHTAWATLHVPKVISLANLARFTHNQSNQSIKSNQIKSNQVKSNQVKSSQIKSNQIKSNQSINQSTVNQKQTNVEITSKESSPRLAFAPRST